MPVTASRSALTRTPVATARSTATALATARSLVLLKELNAASAMRVSHAEPPFSIFAFANQL